MYPHTSGERCAVRELHPSLFLQAGKAVTKTLMGNGNVGKAALDGFELLGMERLSSYHPGATGNDKSDTTQF